MGQMSDIFDKYLKIDYKTSWSEKINQQITTNSAD